MPKPDEIVAGRGVHRVVLGLGCGWFPDQPGGLNRYFRDLTLAARELGIPTRAVVLGPLDEPPPGVEVVSRHDAPLAHRLWAYKRVADDAAAGVDVVDAHFALYSFLPVVLGRLRKVPLVVHFHGPWADESRAVGDQSVASIAVKRLIEGLVYRRATEVVTLSAAFKRLLVERYGVLPWTVSAIPPGVNLDQFTPGDSSHARAELGIPREARVLLCIRRLVSRMGIDVLLEASARLVALEPDLVLLIAGDGPARHELEKRAAHLGLAGRVRFLGRVSEERLLACYRAADFCVVPSTALEGFGLIVLEALACGTPALATEVGGLPEALGGLDPSLIVPAGDAAALASRLQAALDGTKPLPSRKRCRSHAEGFAWESVARRHREIYDRVALPSRKRKIRVVYLDHCARLAGGELALLRLLPALDEVDAHVVLAEEGPLVSRLARAGISVEVLPMHDSARELRREAIADRALPLGSLALSALYTARLATRLRRLRPDLVHTNSLKAAVYGGFAARAVRLPLVWHIRDRIADDYLPPAAVRLIRSLACRLPTAVIANSHATLATLGDLGRRGSEVPSAVVHDPIPVPLLEQQPREPKGDGLCVGLVGRIAPWKGQDVFLKAFARAFPTGSAHALIVGAPLFGEEDYRQGLLTLTSKLALEGRVEFAGFREDIASEFARMDIVVHTSTIPEPFGQVVVEGMAAGRPVVAAAPGGPAEIISDDVDGILYPAGDVDALAQALRCVGSDPELRRRLGEAARGKVRELAPEIAGERVLGTYRDVLRTREGR